MRRSNDTKKKAKSMERQHPPPRPPGKRLYLGYKTSSTGGQQESDEPYSSRSPQHIEVTFTSLSRESGTFFGHNIEVTDEVYAADEVFIVVVRYRDGDTFGTSYGNWTVWAATATEAEAVKIAGSITDGSLVREAEKAKGGAYFPWNGYFNSLEGVEVHGFRVAAKPPEDTSESQITVFRH